jgi:hypothetical protein
MDTMEEHIEKMIGKAWEATSEPRSNLVAKLPRMHFKPQAHSPLWLVAARAIKSIIDA